MLVGKPGLLKEVNEDTIQELIFKLGPVSKPALAKLTDLSLPTVNKIVDHLEEKEVIRQEGVIGSASGRKAKVYVANEEAGSVIAVYFWENQYIAALLNMVGEQTEKLLIPVETETREGALRSTCQAIEKLRERSKSPVQAIGIGVPGVVKKDQTIGGISSIPQWEGMNLKELMEARFQLPVFVENDVKLSTIGYYHTMLEERYENMVYLYIGKGIGSGIILNKMLYRGFSSFAGEFGYLASCEYEKDQTVSYARQGGWLECRVKESSERLEELLTLGIVNYIAALNPQVIVIQGQEMTEPAIKAIEERVRQYIPADSIPRLLLNKKNDCGIDGLFNMCMARLSTAKQLVTGRRV